MIFNKSNILCLIDYEKTFDQVQYAQLQNTTMESKGNKDANIDKKTNIESVQKLTCLCYLIFSVSLLLLV